MSSFSLDANFIQTFTHDHRVAHEVDAYLQTHHVNPFFTGHSVETVQKFACQFFGSLAIGFGSVLLTGFMFSSISVVSVPIGVILVAAGFFAFNLSYEIQDYADSVLIDIFRKEVVDLFDDVSLQEVQNDRNSHLLFPEAYELERLGVIDQEKVKDLLNLEQRNIHQLRMRFLQEFRDKHTWKKMFFYGIPSPDVFKVIYEYQIAHLSVEKAIDLYEEVHGAYEDFKQEFPEHPLKYEIAFPETLKERFEKSANKHIRERYHAASDEEKPFAIERFARNFLERYNFQRLHHYGIIDEATRDFYLELQSDYNEVKRQYDADTQSLEMSLDATIFAEKKMLRESIERDMNEYSKVSCHDELKRLRLEYLRQIRAIYQGIEQQEEVVAQDESLKRLIETVAPNGEIDSLPGIIQLEIEREKTKLKNIRERLHAQNIPHIESKQRHYERLYQTPMQDRLDAKHRLRSRVEDSYAHYQNVIGPHLDYYNRAIQPYRERFQTELAQLHRRALTR